MNDIKKVASVSERLQEALRVKKMRQADLAYVTGIAKGTISNWITGKYEPKSASIAKLAIALDCSDLWLMGFDTTMDRWAFVDPDDAEFLKKISSNLSPYEELPEEIEALNILLHPIGEQITKYDGKYHIVECEPMTEDEVNELLNSVVLFAKTQIDLLKSKHHKNMLDFFAKKNNR